MKTEVTDQSDAAKSLTVRSTNVRGMVILSIAGEERTVKASEIKAATDVAARNPEN